MSGAELVEIGRIVGVHGIRGALKVSGDAAEFRVGLKLIARGGTLNRELEVESAEPMRDRVRLRVKGVADANAAQPLRGASLYAVAIDLPALKDGEYRFSELVGMDVVDAHLGGLGAVLDVEKYPGCDMLYVGQRRLMVPMLRAYGIRVDRAARTIATDLPAGYDDLG